jgi:hypothetical protein
LICELVQLFDPSYVAKRNVTFGLVMRLVEIKPFGERPDLMVRLQRDLPTYIAAANGVSIDHGDERDFTKEIRSWWKSLASEVGAWKRGGRYRPRHVAKFGGSHALLFVAQDPVQKQPRYCPYRLHSRVDYSSLQQNQTR